MDILLFPHGFRAPTTSEHEKWCTAKIEKSSDNFHPSYNLSVTITDTCIAFPSAECSVMCLRSGSHPRPHMGRRRHICHCCRPVTNTCMSFFFRLMYLPDNHTGLPFCFMYFLKQILNSWRFLPRRWSYWVMGSNSSCCLYLTLKTLLQMLKEVLFLKKYAHFCCDLFVDLLCV